MSATTQTTTQHVAAARPWNAARVNPCHVVNSLSFQIAEEVVGTVFSIHAIILRDFKIKHVIEIMKEDEFNILVERLRSTDLPNCPGNLEQNVLRRVRTPKVEESSIWDLLASWLGRPAFVAVTLATVIVSSFATASVISQSHVHGEALTGLGFDVLYQQLLLPTNH